ncbi:hypothetical protein ACI2KR_07950 [Pseudomonas luteola]
MAQQKKPLYDLSPRLTDKICNNLRKIKHLKAKKNNELLKEFFGLSPDMLHSLDLFILAEERFWEMEGNQVIFPESHAVLDNLFRARYQIKNLQVFNLPFKSFILAMPHGYKIDGYEIPSCLITWEKYQTSEHSYLYPFFKWVGLPKPGGIKHQESDPDEMELGIIFQEPGVPMSYQRTLCFGSKVPAILEAKDIHEFAAILGDYSQSNIRNIVKSNEKDLQIQFRLFKLIAALGVYNTATGGEKLISGFPGSVEPKILGRGASQRLVMSTLGNYTSHAEDRTSPDAHYRSWHLRQLMDERFYKGEYSHMPPGSRIVFVKDTVVNGSVSPHTQK